MKRLITVLAAAIACCLLVSCKDKEVVVYKTLQIEKEAPKVNTDNGKVSVLFSSRTEEFKIVKTWEVSRVYECVDGKIGEYSLDSTSSQDTLVWLSYGGGDSRWVPIAEKATIDKEIKNADRIVSDTANTWYYWVWRSSGGK